MQTQWLSECISMSPAPESETKSRHFTHPSGALWADRWLTDSCYKSIHHQRLLNLLHTTHSDDACASRASWLEDITFGWTSLELLYSQVGGLALVPLATTALCNNSSTCYHSGAGAFVCFSTIHQSNVQLKNGSAGATVPPELGEADVVVVSQVIPLTYSVITQCWAVNTAWVTSRFVFDCLKIMHGVQKFKFAWFWSKLPHVKSRHTEVPHSFSSVSLFILVPDCPLVSDPLPALVCCLLWWLSAPPWSVSPVCN